MLTASKKIHAGASDNEWNRLFEWVEAQTPIWMEKRPQDGNPWFQPKLTKEQIRKRLDYAQGGYYGAP